MVIIMVYKPTYNWGGPSCIFWGKNNMVLGKFDHDLTVLPNPGIMVIKGTHSQDSRTFLVSEILEFTQKYGTNSSYL